MQFNSAIMSSVCATPRLECYTLWYQLILHKAHIFLPCLVRHKSIYLGYNNIASHWF